MHGEDPTQQGNQRLGHRASLDGVRGIAVLLVIGFHAINIPRNGGTVGVGIFFVLSGFLITTLLLEEHDRRGTVSLRLFYVRRALRLFPLLYLALAIVALAVPFMHGAERAHYTSSLLWCAFYAGNLYGLTTSFSELAPATAHLWSLAVEEQFYLVWPALLIVILQKVTSRTLLRAVGCAAITSVLLRFVLASAGKTIWTLPTTHGDALLLGCALAIIYQSGRLQPWCERRRRPLAIAALAGSLIAVSIPLVAVSSASGSVYLFIEVLGAGLILVALCPGPWKRVLSIAPLVYCGQISYGLYVIHTLLTVFLAAHAPGVPYLLRGAVGVLAAFATAAASHRWFESRFLAYKDRLRPAERSLSAHNPGSRLEDKTRSVHNDLG